MVLGVIPDLNPLLEVLSIYCFPNIEGLFRGILGLRVKSGKLSEGIVKDLGIFPSITHEYIETCEPNLTVKLVGGGFPILHCDKLFFEGNEVWKDEGNGYHKLDTSNLAKYTDTTPLSTTGVWLTFKYKTI